MEGGRPFEEVERELRLGMESAEQLLRYGDDPRAMFLESYGSVRYVLTLSLYGHPIE